jgi:hypothetical protein
MAESVSRQPLNYVKTRVRQRALDLREFTVEQMVRATSCKRASVQSEIRHMVKDGYLTTQPSNGPRQRLGKPTSVYRLVEDEEKLDRLIAEVTAFRPQRDQGPRQLSHNYQFARQLLDRAVEAPEADRNPMLKVAERTLRAAWADEGDTGGVEDAFFKYEQGRLLFLRKDYEPAGRLFKEAAQTFGRYPGYEAERAKAWEHLVSNILEQTMGNRMKQPMMQASAAAIGTAVVRKPKYLDRPTRSAVIERLQKAAQALMRFDVGTGADNPLQQSLARTLTNVVDSISPQAQLVNAAWNCVSHVSTSAEPMKHEPWRYHYRGSNYCTIKYEQVGPGIRVVQGEPVSPKSRLRGTALQEIKVAVRGPIQPLRSMSAIMMGLKGRK